MKAFRIIARSMRDAFKSIVRNFSLSLASILCSAITLILVSVAIIFATNINSITKSIEDELTIIVYLNEDSTIDDINKVKTKINDYKDYVSEVTLKTKDEWKIEMSKYDESFKTVLDYMDENPFVHSLIVKVKDVRNMTETAEYIKSLEDMGVTSVKYGEGKIETVINAFDIVEKIVIGVVVALVLVTIFLINNTIKLTIFSRRNEIEIMRLVGGSNIAIKMPFIFEGFLIGLIGSIIPICITIYGYVIMYSKLHGHVFSNMIVLIEPYNFVFMVSLVLAAIGAFVGMVASVRAVKKYLKI